MNSVNKIALLLRAVNVSGKNKLPMRDFCSSLSNAGFSAQYVLQSGNIAIDLKQRSIDELKKAIPKILESFEINAERIILSKEELKNTINRARELFSGSEDNKVYIAFTDKKPEREELEALDKFIGGESYTVFQNHFIWSVEEGFLSRKLNTNSIEKKTNCTATARNLRTASKLYDLLK